MSTQIQLRRGTTAQHSSFTGAVGEVTVDTDKKVTVVHDGSTAGGFPAAKDSEVAKLASANTFTAQQTFAELKETVYNLTGTSIDPANGSVQYKTLSGNTTFTEALEAGQSVTLMVDDGTAYTVTWPTMTWVGGSAPTLPTSGYGVIVLWKIGTTLYGKYVGAA